MGCFCLGFLLGVFAGVFLRISADFCGFLHGLQPHRILRENLQKSRRCFCLGVSPRLNGVEKLDIDMPGTPESQCPAISIQERSETQFYTLSVTEASKPKRWVSLGLWCNVASLEKVVFFYDFHGFGGIRSTQPTGGF